MKKLLLLILFLNLISVIVFAQDCDNDFLGTKTLYKKPVQKYTPAPAGYLPVFINHAGRHGARHLTKDVNTSGAYALIMKADSANELTAKGEELKQMVLALQKVEKGNTKSISAEGRAELAGIGERMYKNYSVVFKAKPNLNIRITKEVRTKQSADAFLSGFSKNPLPAGSSAEHNDDTNLRFYDLSPAYKKFEDEVDESEPKISFGKEMHLAEINKAIIARIFKPGLLAKLNEKQEEKFVSDIFGFATIVYSLNSEIKEAGFTEKDVDFKSFFTCDELKSLSILDSADDFLKKGPGVDNNGIQVKIAVPLLVDFIKTTDDFITTGKYNAQLRFAHAETIAPFAALLQISGADKASNNITQINKIWQASQVIPLSSNIQWIFYQKKGTAGYLVKILLNEKEVHISGLKTTNFPYYRWKDLRTFYLNKLGRLHVGLSDDMNAYLTGLK